MRKRLTIDEVNEKLKNTNFKVIDSLYQNAHTPIQYACKICGHIDKAKYANLKKMKNCPECTKKSNREKFSYSLPEVKDVFESNGFVLKSFEYKGAKLPLKCLCVCGNETNISLSDVKRGKRCKNCMKEFNREKFQHDYSFVKNFFEVNNCTLLSNEYVNNKTPLDYICECGNQSTIAFDKFKSGQRCKNCRNKRIGDSHKGRSYPERCGENHVNWNPNKTDEERLLERKFTGYKQWVQEVFNRDDYTCQYCGVVGGSLHAHHLDGYSWCIDKRLELSNGITLCNSCHNFYHLIHGKQDVNKFDFMDFIENNSWSIKTRLLTKE